MTLYSALKNHHSVVPNFFVVDSKEEGYCFNGATLTPQGDYIPNNFQYDKYCALESNQGIGIDLTRITYLVDGKEVAAVQDRFWDIFKAIGAPTAKQARLLADPNRLFSQNPWLCLKERLEKLAVGLPEAQYILAIIQKWEADSLSTLDKAKSIIQKRHSRAYAHKAAIHVAGARWLWYKRDRGLVAIGYQDELWGEIVLDPDTTDLFFSAVSPVSNGWFVAKESLNKDHPEKYLLCQTDQGIQKQPVLFPVGKWIRTNDLTIWPLDGLGLLSTGTLSVIPFCMEMADTDE